MTTRVQIPAYTDRWMMGDRFGEVVKVTLSRLRRISPRSAIPAVYDQREIAHVKLDKSGKTVRVIFDDCREV